MKATDTIAPAPDVVAREVGEETALLDLDNGTYFGLNAVGGAIWSFIEGGPRSVADITAMLVEDYEVSAAEAEADVVALAKDLKANGLVKISES